MSGWVCLPGPRPVLICSHFCAQGEAKGRVEKGRSFWSRMEGASPEFGGSPKSFQLMTVNDRERGVRWGGNAPLLSSSFLCTADLQDSASLTL